MPDQAQEDTKDNGSRDLTTGPVWRALAAMSPPMSFGVFAVLSVGLADAYFLGKVSGAALAAVGFVYPVTTAITSLSIGLSAGANAALSQGVGRGDEGEATRRLGLHAIGLGLVLSIAVAALIWLIFPLIFGALGAGQDVAGLIALHTRLGAQFSLLGGDDDHQRGLSRPRRQPDLDVDHGAGCGDQCWP